MALNTKAGVFSLNTATGAQSVTGVGFTPKIVFFLPMPDTADITIDVANYHQIMGVAVSAAQQGYVEGSSVNGQTTTDSQRDFSVTKIFTVYDTPGSSTVDYQATFVSMDSDGFTINIDNAPPAAYRVGYLALGGADLTNVAVGTFTPTNTLGDKTITGVGFTPDTLMLLTTNQSLGVNNDMSVTVGFTDGITQASTSTWDDDTLATSDTRSEDAVVIHDSEATALNPQEHRRLSFVSFDVDGFTLNQDIAPTTSRPFLYVAMKGAQVAVGNFQLANSVTTTTVTGAGFQPKAGIFMSICHTVLGAGNINDAQYSYGFATRSDEQFVAAGWSDDNAAVSINSHLSHDDFMYRKINAFGSVNEAATFSSWGVDGFSVSVDPALATGSFVHYLLFGEQAAGGGSGSGGGSSDNGAAGTLSGFGDEF